MKLVAKEWESVKGSQISPAMRATDSEALTSAHHQAQPHKPAPPVKEKMASDVI